MIGSDRTAIIVHGLEGNSTRSYMLGMAKAVNLGGWNAVSVNLRGCSGEPNKKARMYHSGDIDDLITICRAVNWEPEKLAIIGFSLGGNLILKMLGELNSEALNLASKAVVFSVPCDLLSCSEKISGPGNRLYLKRFLRLLRKKIQQKMVSLPGTLDDKDYDALKTLEDFDNRYTAPLHGFADARDYYQKSSSARKLNEIRLPTLLVNSLDDPFLAKECYPFATAENSTFFHLETPKNGGHVGFVSFNNGGTYYSERRAIEFLNSF